VDKIEYDRFDRELLPVVKMAHLSRHRNERDVEPHLLGLANEFEKAGVKPGFVSIDNRRMWPGNWPWYTMAYIPEGLIGAFLEQWAYKKVYPIKME
jgi:hypothetical protein